LAWKLVPKSTANAEPPTLPSLSFTNLPVTPAEKRSENCWEYVRPMTVSFTP